MKKKTAILSVCAICAAGVALGIVARGAFREMRKAPKSDVESGQEETMVSENTSDVSYKDAKRPELKDVNTSEFITEDRAKEVALARAGLKASDVARVSAELDFDDGVWKYEVDFKHGGFEYDVDINAESGSVLKFEEEYDD